MAALEEEMVASYSIEIDGIKRTKAEAAALDNAIHSLRAANYSANGSVTKLSGSGRSKDIFVGLVDDLVGRVQTKVQKIVLDGMDKGKELQAATLRAATTETGESGKSHVGGRKGPGREDSGGMIERLARNVEVFKGADATLVTGWHGWPKDGRVVTDDYQEVGTRGRASGQLQEAHKRKVRAPKFRAAGTKRAKGRGVPAANSLGAALPVVREQLKRELGGLK